LSYGPPLSCDRPRLRCWNHSFWIFPPVRPSKNVIGLRDPEILPPSWNRCLPVRFSMMFRDIGREVPPPPTRMGFFLSFPRCCDGVISDLLFCPSFFLLFWSASLQSLLFFSEGLFVFGPRLCCYFFSPRVLVLPVGSCLSIFVLRLGYFCYCAGHVDSPRMIAPSRNAFFFLDSFEQSYP